MKELALIVSSLSRKWRPPASAVGRKLRGSFLLLALAGRHFEPECLNWPVKAGLRQ